MGYYGAVLIFLLSAFGVFCSRICHEFLHSRLLVYIVCFISVINIFSFCSASTTSRDVVFLVPFGSQALVVITVKSRLHYPSEHNMHPYFTAMAQWKML